ncbi:MAG: T9SS type A sorting domain-containing protein [Ignavibacteriae bacterium]|nr:T9SS type A sorting domain-containing protein [Ignavibacteriota bacterium]
MKRIVIIMFVLFVLQQNLYSKTMKVPQDVSTIQAAIDSSVHGDTVLVSPGTYLENINFNGKNIVLGSLFLTTGDTSYISQTIIDGNKQGCVVVFESGEDSTAVLIGFTITNGYSYADSFRGGGITCTNNSNPTLTNLIVKENESLEGDWRYGGGIAILKSKVKLNKCLITRNHSRRGGGIYIENSTVEITNSTIRENVTKKNGMGGGIYADSSNIIITNSEISFNEALYMGSSGPMCQGGGLYFEESHVLIEDCEIINNLSETDGGGISVKLTELKMVGCLIANNRASKVLFRTYGGGINVLYADDTKKIYLEDVVVQNNYAYESGGGIAYYPMNPTEAFKNVTIKNNSSSAYGGGLATNFNLQIPDSSNCSIFLNKTKIKGADIYLSSFVPEPSKNIHLDTTSVSEPNEYHIYPIKDVAFNYNHAVFQSVNSDLFVSPNGSNANKGRTADDPLKTIEFALKVAYADSSHQRNIFLDSGIYSYQTNHEQFPIYGRSYVSIQGDSSTNTILDGEGKSRILEYNELVFSTFKNFTIQNGDAIGSKNFYGEEIEIESGGGVWGFGERKGEAVKFENMVVKNNRANNAGGGLSLEGNVELNKVIISNNKLETASDFGGGAGISFRGYKPAKLINTIICDNYIVNGSSESGGMLICLEDAIIVNSIIWNNQPNNISVYSRFLSDSLANLHVSHSNIEGGEDGIATLDSMKVRWLNGNIDSDPLFVGGDPFDYNLSDNSQCINAGTPFLVWDGDTLINLSPSEYIGDAPDVGALESGVLISVKSEDTIPMGFELYQNYPNPFNPSTTIKYSIPVETFRGMSEQIVGLKIYDVLGRGVTTLVNREQKPGNYEIKFNAKNLSSGIYYYRITAGRYIKTMKMILIN